MSNLLAFKRHDGQVGIRNHLAVISTVVCSNIVAKKISQRLGAEVVTHDTGCLQLGRDRQLTVDTLVGMALSPNVGAVLLVGLGCEQQPPQALLDNLESAQIQHLTIQGSGGTEAAVEKGVELGELLLDKLRETQRTTINWNELTVAIRTSDELPNTLQHIAPLLGTIVDELVDRGCRVVISESWPYVGCGSAFLDRLYNDGDRENWLAYEHQSLELLKESGLDLASVVRRQAIDAHYSTEKLGSYAIAGILENGERPPHRGLWIMKTPHEDIFAGPGILRAGTHVLIHGSSRGNLYSPPILPVLKLCADSRAYRMMPDAYDISIPDLADPTAGAKEVFRCLEEVIRGEITQAERWKGHEVAIPRIGATL